MGSAVTHKRVTVRFPLHNNIQMFSFTAKTMANVFFFFPRYAQIRFPNGPQRTHTPENKPTLNLEGQNAPVPYLLLSSWQISKINGSTDMWKNKEEWQNAEAHKYPPINAHTWDSLEVVCNVTEEWPLEIVVCSGRGASSWTFSQVAGNACRNISYFIHLRTKAFHAHLRWGKWWLRNQNHVIRANTRRNNNGGELRE